MYKHIIVLNKETIYRSIGSERPPKGEGVITGTQREWLRGEGPGQQLGPVGNGCTQPVGPRNEGAGGTEIQTSLIFCPPYILPLDRPTWKADVMAPHPCWLKCPASQDTDQRRKGAGAAGRRAEGEGNRSCIFTNAVKVRNPIRNDKSNLSNYHLVLETKTRESLFAQLNDFFFFGFTNISN